MRRTAMRSSVAASPQLGIGSADDPEGATQLGRSVTRCVHGHREQAIAAALERLALDPATESEPVGPGLAGVREASDLDEPVAALFASVGALGGDAPAAESAAGLLHPNGEGRARGLGKGVAHGRAPGGRDAPPGRPRPECLRRESVAVESGRVRSTASVAAAMRRRDLAGSRGPALVKLPPATAAGQDSEIAALRH